MNMTEKDEENLKLTSFSLWKTVWYSLPKDGLAQTLPFPPSKLTNLNMNLKHPYICLLKGLHNYNIIAFFE